MTTPPGKPAASRQAKIGLALFFFGPWLVYGILLALQPADPFVAWHEDVAWPAEHFLTRSQGGLAMPFLVHLMAGGIGGMFAGIAVAGVFRGIARISGRPIGGGPLIMAAFVVVPIWAFVFAKAVPETVTVIDRQAARMEVHSFHPILRYPTGKVTIAGEDLRALKLSWRSARRSRTDSPVLLLEALTADGTITEIAGRTCDASKRDACLSEGDADIVRLAEWLGHPGSHVVVRPGYHGVDVGK